MAETDKATETRCDKNVGEQSFVDEQEENPNGRKEGEDETTAPSSQVYTATSLSSKPEPEKRLITYPLVIFSHSTRNQKIK